MKLDMHKEKILYEQKSHIKSFVAHEKPIICVHKKHFLAKKMKTVKREMKGSIVCWAANTKRLKKN